ncbi:hypothetical protein C8P68_10290 [Mucilaginibacter yixingensis]|uniref:Uncharacterized protein n=1 Tax=Mucilaginibacter yixingensis TaxID=1295612 RepID=A0A2T5JBY5_9SPHI|nr:hypothetical protein [Mucilaginibacter yixingensis]PTQ99274.1 hypothetical protein C8P68_10290 [Mucilaginibacter yixingensis]
MGSNSLAEFIFHFLPQAVFKCSLLSAPALLIIWHLKQRLIEKRSQVIAVNVAMLIAALLSLAIMVYEFYLAYFSGAEYYQYSINRARGAYWWALGGQLIAYQLLPQLFWLRRFRQSVYAALAIVIPQLVLYYLNKYIILYEVGRLDINHVLSYFIEDWFYYIQIWCVYSLLILLICFINKRRRKTTLLSSLKH